MNKQFLPIVERYLRYAGAWLFQSILMIVLSSALILLSRSLSNQLVPILDPFDVAISIANVWTSTKLYPIPVFSNDVECTQDVKGIIDSPLNIFEIHVYLFMLVNFQNPQCYFGACCLRFLHHFLEYFIAEKHQLFALCGSLSFLARVLFARWLSSLLQKTLR